MQSSSNGKNKLAKSVFKASTKNNNISIPSLIISWVQISALAQNLAIASNLLSIYIDVNLQKTNKFALELFVKDQKHNQANSPLYNYFFKIRNPNLYYESLHEKYY